MTTHRTTELVDDLQSFHCNDPRSLATRELTDRAAVYGRFQREHGYNAADYRELLRFASRREPGSEWVCHWCPVGAVHAVFNFADGAHQLSQIALEAALTWRIRAEALDLIASNPAGVDLEAVEWEKLVELVADENVRDHVRSAAAWALGAQERDEALPTIRKMYDSNRLSNRLISPPGYACRAHMALCVLGDSTALPEAAGLLFSGWRDARVAAKAGFEVLDAKLGGVEIARRFAELESLPFESDASIWDNLKEHPNPSVVRWALTERENGIDLIELLGHSDWGVRKEASNILTEQAAKSELLEAFRDTSQHRLLRSWAAYTLTRLGHTGQDLFPEHTRKDLRVLWYRPNGLDLAPAVRAAIVRHYAPASEEGTDIRYLLEAQFSKSYPNEQVLTDRDRFVDSLTANGFEVDRPRSCGEVQEQGSGTYWVIDFRQPGESKEFSLVLSTIGPFYQRPKNLDRRPDPVDWNRPAEDLDNLGFVELTDPETTLIFPGLNVYHFGSREPISIFELVFFWQD